MLLGDSFVFRSGSDGYHLWVVTSDPFQNPAKVLIVNLTTVRGGHFEDLSCIFEAGEHHWIKNKSYVAFDSARVERSDYLDRLETGTTVEMHNPFPDTLLKRIHAGAAISQNLELGYLQLLTDQGLV